MPDKDLIQGQQLDRMDKTRYVEVAPGIYALLVATQSEGTTPISGTVNIGNAINANVTNTALPIAQPLNTRFVDEVGVAYGIKQIDGKPRVSSMPYTYDVAEGNVAGHTAWTKLGFTPAMNSTDNDLWSVGGLINFPAAETAMEVYANSNTDTGTSIKNGTSTGGSTTTLIDTGQNFNAATAVVVGDCVVLDKSGVNPEYGWVTAVTSNTQLTIAGGFSRGGSGAGRVYNVLDTSATTGAHAVEISYLDLEFVQHREIVILNGQTTADLVNTDTYRINAFRVIAAGSGAKAAGYLSLRMAAGPNTIYSYITAGYTRARNSAYTVPAGLTLYVTEFTVSFGYAAAQTYYARLYTRATQNEGFRTPGIFYPFTEVVLANTSQLVRLDVPTKIISGVDIKVSGITTTTTGTASVALRGWLE